MSCCALVLAAPKLTEAASTVTPARHCRLGYFRVTLRILVDQRPDATVSPSIPNERRGARIDIIWSLAGPGPQPGICLLGSCRRDICPRDICRPAQPRAEAEAVGGRQRLLFPRRLERRRRGSRISTLKSPCESRWLGTDRSTDNLALTTAATNELRNWRSLQPFLVRCCENGTELDAFGSRVART